MAHRRYYGLAELRHSLAVHGLQDQTGAHGAWQIQIHQEPNTEVYQQIMRSGPKVSAHRTTFSIRNKR